MAEPEPDAGDVDEAKEAFGGFVVAGCKAAAIFQLVEAALDHVAQGVDGHVDSLAHPSVPSHRYHGQGVAALDVFPNFIRVIAPVGDQNCWLRQVVGHHHIIAGVVGILPRRDLGPHREACAVDAEMDLGREATSRTAKSLFRSPPFAPAA